MSQFKTLDVTALSRDRFIAIFGGVYEHSSWIAAQVFDAGIDSQCNTIARLHERMAKALEAAGSDAVLAVLRAHPDLAGRAAVAGELTDASRGEQADAGISACTPEQFSRFQELNRAYRDKFGFPFIIAVRGLDRHAILSAFESRINNDQATERCAALHQVHQIAANRLRSL
ncbi:2-oxo-4-hydroxy-4-carboxy-5-ureidoimidazoline decarboxylase [Spiribacter aquaticus]|uniref:2-oxo-4-hydroxy-4-carboxy-5-ureidoimidazoline decarboxylase n=1 Tax=Spiribacter aquaticus TaxID=1935996 RepID=A0A557RMQ3_9GAMM|nr:MULTISPECIES: 2-oxo-4-hydroxy-4-carboxy-5-ureidoimidazoline decarboxylase [Spiribacter]KAF0279497.1 OHCU decarboxylase [Spiribacter roseus]TVO66454.1 2-oxo-4-hydroxy-4-carboxy-5-ureidoimidazoline decarboxylase [Spiribacter aquaticus]